MANPDIPPIQGYKSEQHEFNDEQNRQISALTDAMRVVAGLLQLLGLAFVVMCTLSLAQAAQVKSGYGPAIGLGAAALVCLAIGFRTGSAATSFRRIVETKNEDMWHLMNALRSLHGMYGLLRTIIMIGLVLAVIGLAMAVYAMMS